MSNRSYFVGIREIEDAAERERLRRPRYVVCNPVESGGDWFTFGLPNGGDTREEALFWAERFASKNGLELVLPEGWEDVEPSLPDVSWWERLPIREES